MLSSWEHAESHKLFSNLSELTQKLVYFITLCLGGPCRYMLLFNANAIALSEKLKRISVGYSTFRNPNSEINKFVTKKKGTAPN